VQQTMLTSSLKNVCRPITAPLSWQRAPGGAFHERIWAGEVNLADNDLKVVYGMVHWKQLLRNMREARFSEALRIVSDRDGQSEGMRPLLPTVQ